MTDIILPNEPSLPHGKYAIVELFGHCTIVGRISEVERYGTKMLAIEPLFGGELLDPCLHGGAAIYRLTPCSPQVAWDKQPRAEWQLPLAVRAILPARLLPPPAPHAQKAHDYADQVEDEGDEDTSPF